MTLHPGELSAPLHPGDLVFCIFRMPDPIQHWASPLWIGEVLEPGADPDRWHGSVSETEYCQQARELPVQYSFGVKYDPIDNLAPVAALRLAMEEYRNSAQIRVVFPDHTAHTVRADEVARFVTRAVGHRRPAAADSAD